MAKSFSDVYTAPVFEFDREKFKQVVHYLCHEMQRQDFGRVKLHKTLYFADNFAFVSRGKPLTGVEYIKQQFGPTARYLGAVLKELEAEKAIRVENQDYYGYRRYKFVSLKSPGKLGNWETALLKDVLEFIEPKSASDISNISHNEAWHSVEMGEVIPYSTAYFLCETEITDDDVQWGADVAHKIASGDHIEPAY